MENKKMAAETSVPIIVGARKPEPRVPGRRHHIIEHTITDEERKEYAALKARWEAAESEWENVVREASRRGWGSWNYGDPVLEPLKPRYEIVYDETIEQWRDRWISKADQ